MEAVSVTTRFIVGNEIGPEGGAGEVSDRVDVVTESNGFDPEIFVFGVLLQGSLLERTLRETRYIHSGSSGPSGSCHRIR